MLEPNDKVMVAVSGGKDSFAMLCLLTLLVRKLPFPVSLVACNLDQGQPNFPAKELEAYLRTHGHEVCMLSQDTYSVVTEKVPAGKTYCSLCSRLRRGILYNSAVDMGCTKIALGHHRDDMIETLMLNLLYAGQLKSMPPRLRSDDGRNVIIRPLAYCAEADLHSYAEEQKFPIIPCDLCGSQENLQRKQIKALLNELEGQNPKIRGNMFAALSRVRPTHLLDTNVREAMGLDPVTGERK